LKIAGDGVLAKDRHKAFSAEDLEKIFEAPLFQGCVDDTRNWAKPGDSNPRGTRFWVILLGLYTGARGHEILQLTEDDVEYVNGTPALHFRKQTKTAASRRVIPIHPELIRLGFLEHVDQVRKPITRDAGFFTTHLHRKRVTTQIALARGSRGSWIALESRTRVNPITASGIRSKTRLKKQLSRKLAQMRF